MRSQSESIGRSGDRNRSVPTWRGVLLPGLMVTWLWGCGGGQAPSRPAGVAKKAEGQPQAAPAVPAANPGTGQTGGNAPPAVPQPAVPAAPVQQAATATPQPSAPASAAPSANPTEDGTAVAQGVSESFALVGKPSDLEEFVRKGEDDGTEKMTTKPLPAKVDSTKFRIESGGGASPVQRLGGGAKRSLPKEVEVLEEYGYSPDGLPFRIRVTTKDPVPMSLVPAGAFLRGHRGMTLGDESPETGPEQSITLDSFYMDVTEVTVERYLKMREEHTKLSRTFTLPANRAKGDQLAAVGIAYSDAQFYAKWAGKELPTEAQWEKAARGTEGGQYPWGNGRPIWNRMRTTEQIDEVGSFPSDVSPYGILDLAGNAHEWCRDTYSPKAYEELGSSPEKLQNPIHTRKLGGDTMYVVRGGGSRGIFERLVGVATGRGEGDREKSEDWFPVRLSVAFGGDCEIRGMVWDPRG